MESGAATTRAARTFRRPRTDPRAGVSGYKRVRRIAFTASLVALLPVLVSWASTMSQPSNSSLGIRTVEWLRDHGAAGLVAQIESTYYSLTAPSKGGPTLRALPRVGYGSGNAAPAHARGAGAAAVAVTAAYRPPRVAPLIHPALPGEGQWRATRPSLAASPPVLVTTIRNQPEYPRVLAGLAWIDTKRTTLKLIPGRQEPAGEIPRGSMEIPFTNRAGLLASFNSGFKLADAGGGVVVNGHTYATMRDGAATLVGYADGHSDVIDWQYGSRAPSSVVFARQNLPLIVNHGRSNPNLNNGIEWGATLGNAILVWRSAIGVDRHGNLIYAAGDNQTVGSLAGTMVHAGAVRAMELDINSYWVSFIDYGRPGAHAPTNLLPNMTRSPSRYLEPDDRDFFAVYAR
ncbi:MAG: phosphodiester glycosidase family protein [Actinobacteria bacterium]|nr:MAG: phosphodiester glycosidase family protein [Actinomycetota bacterium]